MSEAESSPCDIELTDEAQNDFFEIRWRNEAKTVIKDLLLCREFPIANGQSTLGPAIDAEYVFHPSSPQLWALRVFGYFIFFEPPQEQWLPPNAGVASLRGAVVLAIRPVQPPSV